MKYTVIYIATRCLRGKNPRFHIIILYKSNNIDIMQHLFALNRPLAQVKQHKGERAYFRN